jgi:hypothetical protein
VNEQLPICSKPLKSSLSFLAATSARSGCAAASLKRNVKMTVTVGESAGGLERAFSNTRLTGLSPAAAVDSIEKEFVAVELQHRQRIIIVNVSRRSWIELRQPPDGTVHVTAACNLADADLLRRALDGGCAYLVLDVSSSWMVILAGLDELIS